MRIWDRVRLRGEAGIVIVWMAVMMVVLLGAAGFAVDLGSWYLRSARLQRAADAAALAGVVWMPDVSRARSVAVETLQKNGIDPARVSVSYPAPSSSYQFRVRLTDSNVASYFSKPFLSGITEIRTAIAEYVLPVPLGSPTNYFGTGSVLASPENLTAAVNGFCTAKEDGDEILSRFDGTKDGNRCPSGVTPPAGPGPNGYSENNDDYQSGGYSYYVELPSGRSQPIVLALYDAPYFTSGSPSPDLPLTSSSAITTTFRLRAADATVFDDGDNPVYTGCNGAGETNARAFTTNQSAFNLSVSGAGTRWTRFCTIPASAPAGRYVLDVWTQATQGTSIGANAYGIMAIRSGAASATCDSRTDAACPRVYGKDRISVFARQAASTAQFYLAEVDPAHAGKQMLVTLWDPGEGGSTIQILDPTGTAFTFDYASTDGVYSGSSTTSLDVSGSGPAPGPHRVSTSKFNDRSVKLKLRLPMDYATRYGTNHWWKIKYTFSSGTVSDRTTWSVRIVGDPVHLVTAG